MSLGAVLITGAAKNIGAAMALHLAKLGYDIALHYNHSQKEAHDLAQQIKNQGVRCETFQCDLNQEKQLFDLLPQVIKKFPNLNILINNASLHLYQNIESATSVGYAQLMDLHVKAPLFLTQSFAKYVKTGLVINMVDVLVNKMNSPRAIYLLSKKTLEHLTLLCAAELAPAIRVNAISPLRVSPDNMDSVLQAVSSLIENKTLNGHIVELR